MRVDVGARSSTVIGLQECRSVVTSVGCHVRHTSTRWRWWGAGGWPARSRMCQSVCGSILYVSVKLTLGTISLLVTDQRPMCDGWTGQIVKLLTGRD